MAERPNATDTHLDVARLDDWIGGRLPGRGLPLQATRLGAAMGIANALFLLTRGDHRWVFRQPPPVKNDPSASDTVREWRILCALDGTDVPHPYPLLLCDDVSVLGRPFLIMSLVDGFTPGFELPEPFLSDLALRRELGFEYVEGCARLSMVDWRGRGLEGLGRPAGFLERQVPRWMAQLQRYQRRELPGLEAVADWLERNRPMMSEPGIIHGDYSPFNVMVSPQRPARLAAIVDWDTGTVGDPLLDIGHLLARWTQPGEEPVLQDQAGGNDGYPTRREMAARYIELTGRDLSALPYYQALALFKLAVILEGTYSRQHLDGVPDDENMMTKTVPRLLRFANAFGRGERQ